MHQIQEWHIVCGKDKQVIIIIANIYKRFFSFPRIESQKEFFAKVLFSDEYLYAAIENNAKYIGSVVETDNGLVIRPSDVEKLDLAAAYYASYHPGLVDGVPTKSFSKYCASHELLLKQYNAFKMYDTKKRREMGIEKKDDEAR